MNWFNRNWDKEDVLFSQKRKIHNRGSDKRPHFIGSFPSRKNPNSEWVTHWGSLNERLFCYLLEIDPLTVRYYVQPVNIQIPFINKEGERGTWSHTPDVLFFRQGLRPYLVQIKESPEDITPKVELCNKHSYIYAKKEGWEYKVIYPKMMPQVVKKNLEFLMGCIKERQGYSDWISILYSRVRDLGKIRVSDLSLSYKFQCNQLFLNTVIYHMIARGILFTDIFQLVNSESLVWVAEEPGRLPDYFKGLGEGFHELCSTQS